jgi:superfamily II DNA or RNA helicase
MPTRTSKTGSELFIVDNSDADWKVLRYLHDWCQISRQFDIASGYFELGALLGLKDEWQKVDKIRILMGEEVSLRTREAFAQGLRRMHHRLDQSLEAEKLQNDFLLGVPAIVDAIKTGKIECRVYRKEKFHAKAYITHARLEVVGAAALVGSSNFTFPGITQNIELNVQITGRQVHVLQEWYEEHWKDADDVTPDVLRVIERHVREFSPFEVYAKSLHELLGQQELSDKDWLENHSVIWPILDQYQKDGFRKLIKIADAYSGAFLCDGVGLGKTFVGLMLIEYLIEKKRKRVALFVPKVGREAVWERALEARGLGHLVEGVFSGNFVIFNHTDLGRGGKIHAQLARTKQMADVVLIDEAHHFRNPGFAAIGKGIQATRERPPSRYHLLSELLDGPTGVKQVFMLTATPVNNSLLDLQHMMELFTSKDPAYFKGLGIHSLPGHFRKMEKDLVRMSAPAQDAERDGNLFTDMVEAEEVLTGDKLCQALVVQRSRAFVRQSQMQQGIAAAMFPMREDPQVAKYNLQKTYGKLLKKVDDAFAKQKPLFSLPIYYPLAYYQGSDTTIDPIAENRQKQIVGLIRTNFLKRFESSAEAFRASCERLLKKLLAFVKVHSDSPSEQRRLERWMLQHKELIGYIHERQLELFPVEEDEADEDIIPAEMLADVEKLDPKDYKVDEILAETFLDLDQIAEFLHELCKFEPKHDDKLNALLKLLEKDPVLSKQKVLIFTEFADTARYLRAQLEARGITAIEQVDSAAKRDRADVIRRFAPYYNGCTSKELGKSEIRILISTDVLSEGLNLQDATRLINYDLHWNPVRLMQRIGRVDRRLDPEAEKKLVADHPEQEPLRGKVAYWNFLPPEELNELLHLYSLVSHKTLRISRTFGIEGKKLLTPEDDYEALRNFNHIYEGDPTQTERLQLEYEKLLHDHPGIADQLDALPGRIFSGKKLDMSGVSGRYVFFCYSLPAQDHSAPTNTQGNLPWTEEAGKVGWYLYEVESGNIVEEPAQIAAYVRSTPETPRHCVMDKETLKERQTRLEKHIKNTYLKNVQAPAGVKPVLRAWMELS